MKNRGRMRATLIVSVLITFSLLAWVVVAGYTPKLGLDLAGGTSVVLTAPSGTDSEVLDKAADVIRLRTDGLGVAEPEITVEGSNIVVQLPGLDDEARALEIIGATAELGFRQVLQGPAPAPETDAGAPFDLDLEDLKNLDPEDLKDLAPSTTTPPADTAPADQSAGVVKLASLRLRQEDGGAPPPTDGQVPPTTPPATGVTITPSDEVRPDAEVTLLDQDGTAAYMLAPQALPGRDVTGATAQVQSGSSGAGGQWVVQLEFNSAGEAGYAELTGKAACSPEGDPQRSIAIVLDDRVVSAPQVAQGVECGVGITGGGVITLGGDDQEKEAKDLALVLRFGSLPVELQQGNIATVSPTLGQDSIDAGKIAAIVGLVLIALFVVGFYRIYGLIILAGLVEYGILMYVFLALAGEFIGQALTLAGIAGIVISIGLSADSAIVYIERVKDELRDGRIMTTAVQRGFQRAWKTIVAGDVVSLLAAVILYVLAVGPIKGFALLLGVSVLLDLLISWFFVRPLVLILGDSRVFSYTRWLLWHRPQKSEEQLVDVGAAP